MHFGVPTFHQAHICIAESILSFAEIGVIIQIYFHFQQSVGIKTTDVQRVTSQLVLVVP